MRWKKASKRKKVFIALIAIILLPIMYILIARQFLETPICDETLADLSAVINAKKHARDSSSERLPNVVFILSDDQAWNDYGFMGHPQIHTPNLDKLANESLTFTRGYVTAPLCSPSLASIISGLHPHQHGIYGNDPVFEYEGTKVDLVKMGFSESYLRQRNEAYVKYLNRFYSKPNLIKALDTMGYVSFQSGKWWLGNWKDGGFDNGMTTGDPECDSRHGDMGLTIGRNGMKPVFDFIDETVDENAPFFLWYAPFMPHWPHTPPDSLLNKYSKVAPNKAVAKYWAMCEWFDMTIGQLLNYVESKGQSENTIVVYVSDNGWIQDSGFNIQSLISPVSKYAPRSKRSPYEGGVRTPILIKWPEKIEPKIDESNVVSAVDIVPTVLNLIGADKTEEMEGLNLTDSIALTNRKYVFSADYLHDMQNFEDPLKSLESKTVIKGPWKLILPNKSVSPEEKVQLYNLIQDENEENNLATKHPELVNELTGELQTWW